MYEIYCLMQIPLRLVHKYLVIEFMCSNLVPASPLFTTLKWDEADWILWVNIHSSTWPGPAHVKQKVFWNMAQAYENSGVSLLFWGSTVALSVLRNADLLGLRFWAWGSFHYVSFWEICMYFGKLVSENFTH